MATNKRSRAWYISVCAALFTLFTCIMPWLAGASNRNNPQIIEHLSIDQAHYLTLSLKTANREFAGTLDYLYSVFDRRYPLFDVLVSGPHAVTDLIVGTIGTLCNLPAEKLGLFLDIFCSFFCFYTLLWGFSSVVSHPSYAVLPTFFTLFLPYVAAFHSYQSVFQFIGVPIRYLDYDLPVFRAVYTQLSYIPFLFLVTYSIDKLTNSRLLPRHVLFLGLLAGLVGYIYFFTWIACLYFLIVALILDLALYGNLRATLRNLAYAVGAFTLASSGVFWIIFTSQTDGIVEHAAIRRNFFFSLPEFSFLLALIGLWKFSTNKRFRVVLGYLVGCLAFELIAMNLQPLLGQGICPYHFPRYYSQPLFTGLVILMLSWTFKSVEFKAPRCVFSLLFLLLLVSSACGSIIGVDYREKLDTLDLAEFVKENSDQQDTFAILSDSLPFRSDAGEMFTSSNLPNLFYSLTNRAVLHQSWVLPPHTDQEAVQRELFLGNLFSGKTQLLWPCPEVVSEPGDLFYLTWTYQKLHRLSQCLRFRDLIASYSACDAVNAYPVSYLLHYKGQPNHPRAEEFLELVFTSPHQFFHLYRISREGLRRMVC